MISRPSLSLSLSSSCQILTTFSEILVLKAKTALERYSHNLVIGNLLSTRKWEVVFVAPGRPDKWIRIPSAATIKAASGHKRTLSEMEGRKDPGPAEGDAEDDAEDDKPLDPSTLPEGDPDTEIESLIIPALKDFHTTHIEEAKRREARNGRA